MSRFQTVPAPVFSPTRCALCMTSSHPEGFVDLLVDNEAVNGYDENGSPVVVEGQQNFGHLYACFSCVDQVIVVRGGLDPALRRQLEERLDVSEAERETLAERVAFLEDPANKSITGGELEAWLRRGGTDQPEPETVEEPEEVPARKRRFVR